jgi:tetrahydromethanopterin S-methyltransferase subunit B
MSENIAERMAIVEDPAGETDAPVAVSQKKLQANRENAKKSTGPRTARGKAYSRRNATKHGLFTHNWMEFVLLGEDPCEYEKLLADLCEQYQPVGRAEKLEVERIAVCWWKLKRVERYESAVTRVAIRDLARKELARQEPYLAEKSREEDAHMLQLENAKKQVEETGVISEELKKEIFAKVKGLEPMWSSFERTAEELLTAGPFGSLSETFPVEERSYLLAILTLTRAQAFIKEIHQFRTKNVNETALAEHVIPQRENLDRILRYETSIERNLSRSTDRLERLQRRRKGEPVPPPVRVRLTQ